MNDFNEEIDRVLKFGRLRSQAELEPFVKAAVTNEKKYRPETRSPQQIIDDSIRRGLGNFRKDLPDLRSPHQETPRLVLADYLADAEDPREYLLRHPSHEEARHDHYTAHHDDSGNVAAYYQTRTHSSQFSDGTALRTKILTTHDGDDVPKTHAELTWEFPNFLGLPRLRHTTALTPSEAREFLSTLPESESKVKEEIGRYLHEHFPQPTE